jgi:hypothetical protein
MVCHNEYCAILKLLGCISQNHPDDVAAAISLPLHGGCVAADGGVG